MAGLSLCLGFPAVQLDPELWPPVSRSKITKSLPYSSGSIFVIPKTITFVPLMAGGERDVLITPSSPSTLTWCSLAWILENFTRERLPGLWPCLVSGHRVPPPLSRAYRVGVSPSVGLFGSLQFKNTVTYFWFLESWSRKRCQDWTWVATCLTPGTAAGVSGRGCLQ